jgi:hypothetical protein
LSLGRVSRCHQELHETSVERDIGLGGFFSYSLGKHITVVLEIDVALYFPALVNEWDQRGRRRGGKSGAPSAASENPTLMLNCL